MRHRHGLPCCSSAKGVWDDRFFISYLPASVGHKWPCLCFIQLLKEEETSYIQDGGHPFYVGAMTLLTASVVSWVTMFLSVVGVCAMVMNRHFLAWSWVRVT